MTRRDRFPLLVLVGILGLGLLAAAYAIFALTGSVRQQQQNVADLLARDAENRQALSDQQRLVRGLQAQVLKLGGKPLLTPPASAPQQPSRPSSGGGSTTLPNPSGQPPSATPAPTPRPTHSPVSSTPTPSPSPSGSCRVKVGPLCV